MPDDANAELITAARDAAAAGTDLYELLGVDASTGAADIHRAWRRKGLQYHPDKAGASYDAARYEAFERARNVLTDEAARAAYDGARAAALLRQQQADRMGAERRRFRDELEAAERAAREGKAAAAGAGRPGAAADAELEALREAGRKRADDRARAVREAEEREERRKEDRIAELERRLREKEDRARRRAERKGQPYDAGTAAAEAPAAGPPAEKGDGEWRKLLGSDQLPFGKRPIYAYTLARMRAAEAQRQERLRAQGKPAAPAFVPQWDEVKDPEVKKFIARVPRFGPPAKAGNAEMDLTA